ncbi:hypothetical protein C2845_PM01G43280 [Panicum miliaceum]|uniref:KIB1-4 beta-propeller domain-containing protein n=1 Tax=Panicum miliaceum TaxID=4540 RepID=A0A3L6TRY5_PANMI|nr:hypothetical protein C2845_PM01G43280 [Panicum miliaceum]
MANRRRPRAADSARCQILPCEHKANKRRRAAADAGTSTAWSSMHADLVGCIAERVLAGDLLDYVRFRAACPHWRSCTVDPRGRGVADPRFHPRRWMMLPEGHGLHPGHRSLGGRVRFFNRDTGAFVGARIPELKDHCILDSPDGLLLLQRDADTAVRLVHPFTGDIADLPPLKSLLPQLYQLTPEQPRLDGDHNNLPYFRRVAAAISVAGRTGTVTVILALEHLCRFAHASTADGSWTLTSWSANRVSRALPFHGSLYMVYCDGSEEASILRLDPPLLEEGGGSPSSSSLLPPQAITTFPAKLMILPQLVECDSEILVVGSTDISCSHLVVIRLAELLLGRPAEPLKSIGDHCLFFGMRSLAVSSKGLPSIAGNSIILCDSIKDRLMQYNLSDDTLLPACDGDITRTPPPNSHSIVHHLVTCCYRYFWNKGLIYCARTDPTWRTKHKQRFGV